MANVSAALSLRVLSLRDFANVTAGVLANNTARQTNRAAIQAAIDWCIANDAVLMPGSGTYEIHNAGLIIPSNFRWFGTMNTKIVQYSLNLPVIHVGSPLGTVGATVEKTIIDGAELRYAGVATAGGNALEMNGAYMCDFRNLQIGDVNQGLAGRTSVPYMGIFCDEIAGTTPTFSCSFTNIRIKHFGYRGISMNRLNFEAATGNVFSNIYIGGGDASGRQDLSAVANSGALVLGSQAQCVWNQLNIEWMTTPSVIRMEVCDQCVFNSVNLEGIILKASVSSAIGYFDLYNGSITVEGLTINNCTMNTANNCATAAVARLGPASIARFNNVRPLLNSATAPFYAVRSNSATNSRMDIGQWILGNNDRLTAYDDGVFAAGTGNNFCGYTDFHGGGFKQLVDAASTTVYSYRGESVVRLTPTGSSRTIVLARQCSSTITTLIPPGTRKRIRNSAAATSTIAVQNYNAAAIITIAAASFNEFVFDGTNWVTG